ncbi:MAG: hypothetical protein ACRDNZ_11295 [Streptosporangiaceae bacterium]
MTGYLPTTSHWGAYGVRPGPAGGIEIAPHPDDPAPAPMLGNIPGSLRHPARVAQPAVRRGWLEHGPGPARTRGQEEFVEVGWDRALDLVAAEIRRVRAGHGNRRSSAARTAGPAPGGFTTPRVSCTGCSTWRVVTPLPGTAIARAPRKWYCRTSSAPPGASWTAARRGPRSPRTPS